MQQAISSPSDEENFIVPSFARLSCKKAVSQKSIRNSIVHASDRSESKSTSTQKPRESRLCTRSSGQRPVLKAEAVQPTLRSPPRWHGPGYIPPASSPRRDSSRRSPSSPTSSGLQCNSPRRKDVLTASPRRTAVRSPAVNPSVSPHRHCCAGAPHSPPVLASFSPRPPPVCFSASLAVLTTTTSAAVLSISHRFVTMKDVPSPKTEMFDPAAHCGRQSPGQTEMFDPAAHCGRQSPGRTGHRYSESAWVLVGYVTAVLPPSTPPSDGARSTARDEEGSLPFSSVQALLLEIAEGHTAVAYTDALGSLDTNIITVKGLDAMSTARCVVLPVLALERADPHAAAFGDAVAYRHLPARVREEVRCLHPIACVVALPPVHIATCAGPPAPPSMCTAVLSANERNSAVVCWQPLWDGGASVTAVRIDVALLRSTIDARDVVSAAIAADSEAATRSPEEKCAAQGDFHWESLLPASPIQWYSRVFNGAEYGVRCRVTLESLPEGSLCAFRVALCNEKGWGLPCHPYVLPIPAGCSSEPAFARVDASHCGAMISWTSARDIGQKRSGVKLLICPLRKSEQANEPDTHSLGFKAPSDDLVTFTAPPRGTVDPNEQFAAKSLDVHLTIESPPRRWNANVHLQSESRLLVDALVAYDRSSRSGAVGAKVSNTSDAPPPWLAAFEAQDEDDDGFDTTVGLNFGHLFPRKLRDISQLDTEKTETVSHQKDGNPSTDVSVEGFSSEVPQDLCAVSSVAPSSHSSSAESSIPELYSASAIATALIAGSTIMEDPDSRHPQENDAVRSASSPSSVKSKLDGIEESDDLACSGSLRRQVHDVLDNGAQVASRDDEFELQEEPVSAGATLLHLCGDAVLLRGLDAHQLYCMFLASDVADERTEMPSTTEINLAEHRPIDLEDALSNMSTKWSHYLLLEPRCAVAPSPGRCVLVRSTPTSLTITVGEPMGIDGAHGGMYCDITALRVYYCTIEKYAVIQRDGLENHRGASGCLCPASLCGSQDIPFAVPSTGRQFGSVISHCCSAVLSGLAPNRKYHVTAAFVNCGGASPAGPSTIFLTKSS